MKTKCIICMFLMNLLIGGLCDTDTHCDRTEKAAVIRNDNGGRVTLQVTVMEEIEEIHWLRNQTQNVFFRIMECCRFEKNCCQFEDPEDCCRIENTTYEAKLCSCDVSSLSSSITICNVTSEDVGWFLADIKYKKMNSSTCTFYLSGGKDNPKHYNSQTSNKTIITNIVLIIIVVLLVVVIAVLGCCFRKRIRECWKWMITERNEAVSFDWQSRTGGEDESDVLQPEPMLPGVNIPQHETSSDLAIPSRNLVIYRSSPIH